MRAFLILLCLPCLASAQDWAAAAASLGSESAEVHEAATAALLAAGPEADPAIHAAAASPDPEISFRARRIASRRRWDPEGRLTDLDVAVALDSPDVETRRRALPVVLAAGPVRSELVLSRILLNDPGAAEPVLRALATSSIVSRDPRWLPWALRFLPSPRPSLRSLAATALARHGNRYHAAEARLALAREGDRTVRIELWTTLARLAHSAADFPAVTPTSEELQRFLPYLLHVNNPRLERFAWTLLERHRPTPPPDAFLKDLSRLLRLYDPPSLAPLFENRPPRAYVPAADLKARLARSSSPALRAAAASTCDQSLGSLFIVLRLLHDPEDAVRQSAQRALTEASYANWDLRPAEQRRAWERFGARAEAALESAAGVLPEEQVPALVRGLLEEGMKSGTSAIWAIELLDLCRAQAKPALAALVDDPDVGVAAKNVRRVMESGFPPGEFEFDDDTGLGGRMESSSISAQHLPNDSWFRMARSEEVEDRRLAAETLWQAWDDLGRRQEVLRVLKDLATDADAEVKEMAGWFADGRADELVPEPDRISWWDFRERKRAYVLARLKKALDEPVAVPFETVDTLLRVGNRSLTLAFLRSHHLREAGSFLRLGVCNEPGALPILLQTLEDPWRPAWASIAWALSACGPDGARILAAYAAQADPRLRAISLGPCLARAWGSAAAEPVIVALCASDDPEDHVVLVQALQLSRGRGESALSGRSREAILEMLVRLARDPRRIGVIRDVLQSGIPLLRHAPDSIRRAFADDPVLFPEILVARTPVGPLPHIWRTALEGSRSDRDNATALLWGTGLPGMAIATRIWLEGDSSEVPAAFNSLRATEASWAWAFHQASLNPDRRDDLLTLATMLARDVRLPAEVPALPQVPVDMPAPGGFFGPFESDRLDHTWKFRSAPTPETFASLASVAFRGLPGDEVALLAVLPHLGPAAFDRVVLALGHRDAEVRERAASTLALNGAPAAGFARAALETAVASEKLDSTRARMLAALARLGAADAFDRLDVLARGEPDVRMSAVQALVTIPDPRAARILARLAGDDDHAVSALARQCLALLASRPDSLRWYPPHASALWSLWLDQNPFAPLQEIPPERIPQSWNYDW